MSGSAVAVFTHPDCLAHDPGPGHPETPARLEAVTAAPEMLTCVPRPSWFGKNGFTAFAAAGLGSRYCQACCSLWRYWLIGPRRAS